MKRESHRLRLSAALLAFALMGLVALAAPAAAHAYSTDEVATAIGKIRNDDGSTVYWGTSVADCMDAVSKLAETETNVTIELLTDWDTASYGTLKFDTAGKHYSLRLHGHMINRGYDNVDESTMKFKGEGDGDVIRLSGENTQLYIYGSENEEEAQIPHNGKFLEDKLGGKFWKCKASGEDQLTGGLITGGGCDDSMGGGGITIKEHAYAEIKDTTIAGNVADTYGSIYGHGGGICCEETYNARKENVGVRLDNSHVEYNHACGWGGGIYGGAITMKNGSTCNYNTAEKRGGGVAFDPPGNDHLRQLMLDDASEVCHNVAGGNGGGCYFGGNEAGRYDLLLWGDSKICYNTSGGNGGGVAYDQEYNHSGLLDIYASHVDHNTCTGKGGGFYFGSSMSVDPGDGVTHKQSFSEGSTVSFNTASENGGGMAFDETADYQTHTLDFGQLTMEGNHSGENGGAIAIIDPETLNTIFLDVGTKFVNNSADKDGGAIWVGCEINLETRSIVNGSEVHNVGGITFEGNKAGGSGGAIFSDDNKFNLRLWGTNKTVFKNNSAKDNGGAIFMKDHSSHYTLDVQNAEFTGNTVGTKDADGWGGAIWVNHELTLEDVTVTGNTATKRGGGIFVSNTDYYDFTLKGTVVIDGNYLVDKDAEGNQTAKSNGRSNLSLKGLQTVCGSYGTAALTADSKIGITVEYYDGAKRQISGNTDFLLQEINDGWPSVVYSDNPDYSVYRDGDYLYLGNTKTTKYGVTVIGAQRTDYGTYAVGGTVKVESANYPMAGEDGNMWMPASWTLDMGGESKTLTPTDGAVSFALTGPATVRANYAPCYTVDFDTGGADPIDSQQVLDGGLATKPDDPVREGYIFDGWYADEDLTEEFDFDAPISANATVYAKWTETVTVTFHDAGGATITPASVTIRKGASLGTLPVPESSDRSLVFTGWETADGEPVSGSTTFDKDTTIYTTWTAGVADCIVTFMDGDSSWMVVRVDAGKTIDADLVPVKEGYEFAGWYTDAACTDGNEWDAASAVTESMVLHAKWTPKSYTVSFMDGDDVLSTQQVSFGSMASEPESPGKDGYAFTGWYANKSCTREFDFESTPIAGDTKVYAGWEKVRQTVTVTFDTGVDGLTVDPVTVYEGTALGWLPAPEREGYTLEGWYTDAACADGSEWSADSTVAGSMTLYAKWEKVRRTVTVTFDTGVEGLTVEPVTVEEGTTLDSLPTLEREGYTFEGWYADADCTEGDEWGTDSTVTESMTLYAKWAEVVDPDPDTPDPDPDTPDPDPDTPDTPEPDPDNPDDSGKEDGREDGDQGGGEDGRSDGGSSTEGKTDSGAEAAADENPETLAETGDTASAAVAVCAVTGAAALTAALVLRRRRS